MIYKDHEILQNQNIFLINKLALIDKKLGNVAYLVSDAIGDL